MELPNSTDRASLQSVLTTESARLEAIYSAALYGGRTLADNSLADGITDDAEDGGLFKTKARELES